MKRLSLLTVVSVLFVTSAGAAGVGSTYKPLPPLKVTEYAVDVSVEKPFKVLHVSDSHVVRIDSRDTPELRESSLKRSRMGRELGDYYLDVAICRARSAGMPLVHTGDMIAYYGPAGLERAGRLLATDDIIATVGNHEYWLSGESKDVQKNEAACREGLKAAFGQGAGTYEREINGVLFFVFNNASQLVTQETADAFDRTVAKKKPIVMVCHVPLATEGLQNGAVCGWKDAKHDQLTLDFVEKVRREPLVKAVLAGHLHGKACCRFSPTAMEYVADALFNGTAQEITFGVRK